MMGSRRVKKRHERENPPAHHKKRREQAGVPFLSFLFLDAMGLSFCPSSNHEPMARKRKRKGKDMPAVNVSLASRSLFNMKPTASLRNWPAEPPRRVQSLSYGQLMPIKNKRHRAVHKRLNPSWKISSSAVDGQSIFVIDGSLLNLDWPSVEELIWHAMTAGFMSKLSSWRALSFVLIPPARQLKTWAAGQHASSFPLSLSFLFFLGRQDLSCTN